MQSIKLENVVWNTTESSPTNGAEITTENEDELTHRSLVKRRETDRITQSSVTTKTQAALWPNPS